jgi:tRNA pseudouridine55 synthase
VRTVISPVFLVVDKPVGVTSHDVVSIVRALVGAKRVGHTGTLDPFATGVLPLALGPATRLISFLDESRKVYEATLALGASTETGDPEGAVVETKPVPSLALEQVEAVLNTFVGSRMQTPPPYSAVKVNGRPLYSYARAGESVSVPPRPIEVYEMALLECTQSALRFRVACGRGTYVRVLGEELAAALGTVGHLVQLRRLQSGPFHLSGSVTLPELARIAVGEDQPSADWRAILRPARDAPRVTWRDRSECRRDVLTHAVPATHGFEALPVVRPEAEAVARLLQSGICPPPPGHISTGERFVVADEQGMVALCENANGGGKAIRVLARPPQPTS